MPTPRVAPEPALGARSWPEFGSAQLNSPAILASSRSTELARVRLSSAQLNSPATLKNFDATDSDEPSAHPFLPVSIIIMSGINQPNQILIHTEDPEYYAELFCK